jgi:hypothetical protein
VLFYFDTAHIVNSPVFFYRGYISTYLLHEGNFLMVGNWGIVLCEEFYDAIYLSHGEYQFNGNYTSCCGVPVMS